jgi:adenylate cyclase
MTEIDRLRRAGGGVLRMLVDLIPVDMPPDRHPDEDVEMCLVFADVADYSEFVAGSGDDAAMSVLEVLDDIVECAVQAYPHARVVKRLGDGLMIAVDEPAEAVHLAVCLVEQFAQRTADVDTPLQLRAGVHRGTCRTRGGDFFGYNVNLAARVTASARPGRTLATAHALAGVDLADRQLVVKTAGRLRAKGVSNPVALFRIERATDADRCQAHTAHDARSPLFGRLPRVPGLGERRSKVG